ncbi:MAG: DNA polymerase III subunit gamma/tau, partial [bacterium]
IHHAYLFTGVRGVGKTTVARILARALNCEKPKNFEPCGNCPPCTEITAGRSMDVQEIDGASNTGVDDVREIRERVKYMPSSGKYKIYIIDEVHMLSTPAFNALLKTLEEPPAHVIFIFATTESQKIPATILSRCQRYDFRRIPAPLIAGALKRIAATESVTIDDDALGLIAREATGSLRDAQSLFDQAIAFAGTAVTLDSMHAMLGCLDRTLLFDTVAAGLDRDARRALAALDKVFLTGADLTRFAGEILEVLRHMLVIAECGEERATPDLPADEIAALKKLCASAEPCLLHQMFALWYGIAESVARSPFPKMLLEVGLLRLCRITPMKPISEIVAKLDALLEGDAPARPVAPEALAPLQREEPKKVQTPAPARINAPAASPTFEPAAASDIETERRWQDFMRWVIIERPQVASILQQGSIEGMDGDTVRIRCAKPHFAEMLMEQDRREKVEELLSSFFKKPMKLSVNSEGAADEKEAPRGNRKKELVREALKDDIVKQAADILGAQLHDVKTSEK